MGFIRCQEERVLRRGTARSAKHLYVLPVPPKEPETPYPDTLTPIGPPGYLIPPPRVKRLDGFPFADTWTTSINTTHSWTITSCILNGLNETADIFLHVEFASRGQHHCQAVFLSFKRKRKKTKNKAELDAALTSDLSWEPGGSSLSLSLGTAPPPPCQLLSESLSKLLYCPHWEANVFLMEKRGDGKIEWGEGGIKMDRAVEVSLIQKSRTEGGSDTMAVLSLYKTPISPRHPRL